MYTTLKLVHVSAVILTVSGFALRGVWMLAGSPMLSRRLVRIVPHVVDTVLLLSGVGLILTLHLAVMSQPWLLAKFAALLVYIALGTVALRPGRPRRTRAIAFFLALVTFAYVVAAALGKSALPYW